MAYGIKYTATFKNTANVNYTLQILEDGFVGDNTDIILTGNPITSRWETDEPQPAIKGSSLLVNIINDGTLPITSFYSESDTQFKAVLFWEADEIWEGYLVQDDCKELMADWIHEISLSFNDNLGLLKDVALDATNPDFGGDLCVAWLDQPTPIPDDGFIYLYDSKFIPAVGVPFTIAGHINTNVNGTWTPTAVTNYRNGNFVVTIAGVAFATPTVSYPCRIINASAQFDFYGRQSLLNIIGTCLFNTSLRLEVDVYANIFEIEHNQVDSFLAQTFVDCKIFLNGDVFKSCWDVLTEVLTPFKLTLFQSNHRWNIVRWQEFRYYTSPFPLPYFSYDSDLYRGTAGTLNKFFTTGIGELTYAETGVMRSVTRPFKFTKETFNYVQPEQLIINSDLKKLGDFDSTSNDGTFDYNLYEFPERSKWLHFFEGSGLIDTSKICVKIETSTGKEVDRYVLQPRTNSGGGGTDDFACVQFNDIQVTEGDRFDFSIRTKSASSTSGDPVLWRWGFMLCPDEGSYYGLNQNGTWTFFGGAPNSAANGFSHAVPAADAEEFYDFNLSSFLATEVAPTFPITGVLRIRIYGANTTTGAQPVVSAIWKDITITMEQYINNSVKIIGQTHNAEQDVVIKNNSATDVLLDDSPRSTIAGTLFRIEYVGLSLWRTELWRKATLLATEQPIGEIITKETEVWMQVSRAKLEGNFYGLVQGSLHFSMLAIITNTFTANLNYIFGLLEIDYRNNNFNCTQFEIYENGEELETRPAIDYNFEYIYNTK